MAVLSLALALFLNFKSGSKSIPLPPLAIMCPGAKKMSNKGNKLIRRNDGFLLIKIGERSVKMKPFLK